MQGERCEDRKRSKGLMIWELVLAGLNGTAGGVAAVAGAIGGGLASGGAAEELEAGDGFKVTMGHERHPSERQHQSHHRF